MRKGFISFVIACIGFSIMSCVASKQTSTSVSFGGEWSFVELSGQKLSGENPQNMPVIGFDAKNHRIYGNSGCNRMMGTYVTDTQKPGSLSFGNIGSTRMACPDMTLENSVLAALAKVKSFKVLPENKNKAVSPKVAFLDSDGKQVAIIEKMPLNISSLNGEWKIMEVNGSPIGKSEQEPFIGFDVKEERIYGSAGCNNMNGAFKQETNNPFSLNFGQVITTMMACPDMSTEDIILKALNQVKSFRFIEDKKVGLYNADGQEIFVLLKK